MSKSAKEPYIEYQTSDIHENLSNAEVIALVNSEQIDWKYLDYFKKISETKDEVISSWFNISVKTLRNYKKPDTKLKDNLKEQLVLLLSLFAKGKEVFGSNEEFKKWLETNNFFFDGKAPVSFLNTIAGIRFVEDRLTAMEYGDNI
jgi:uncharacterized protein (DUF2384 family)